MLSRGSGLRSRSGLTQEGVRLLRRVDLLRADVGRLPRPSRRIARPRPQATPPADDDVLSEAELAMLAQIADPEQREMQRLQMIMQKQALLNSSLTNLASMRHDMLRKSVSQNFRA